MIALLIIAVVVIVIIVYNINKAKKREAELATEREAEKRKIQKRNEEKKLREEGRPLQEADGLTRKYMEKPIIIEASQRVKKKFVVVCKENAIRWAEHFNMEHSNYGMSVEARCSKDGWCSKIEWGDERGLDFRKENLQCLHTREDMEACVRAIAILAYQQISCECSEDKNADVNVREYLSSEISGECKFYITLQYLFANPNYVPPAEW